jgi:hypothetical protein
METPRLHALTPISWIDPTATNRRLPATSNTFDPLKDPAGAPYTASAWTAYKIQLPTIFLLRGYLLRRKCVYLALT